MNSGRLLISESEEFAAYLNLFLFLAVVLNVQLVEKNLFMNYNITHIPSWEISFLYIYVSVAFDFHQDF